MIWVGLVVCMGEKRGAYMIFLANLRATDHLEYLGIYSKILLKWICKTRTRMMLFRIH
jgi:hypothetical protein